MKLTALLVVLFSIPVLGNSFAQTISLSVKEANLQEVMEQIQKQSGYSFLFDEKNLEFSKPVTINLKAHNLDAILKTVFSNQPFEYTVKGKMILLKYVAERQQPPPSQQPQKISGTVTDSLGNPLAGVTVRIKGTTHVTSTDGTGNFIFHNVPDNPTLTFSLMGYSPYELTNTNENTLTIMLKQETSVLKEAVVKGYYTTTRELNTGSVSSVKAEVLARQPVSDPLKALDGRIPGLYLSQHSGLPGAQIAVTLRGRNSIANGNAPLYIIDGIPFTSTSLSLVYSAAGSISPFSSIGMNNIETIDVLKDADATAIYGSRGANGVILITTKKGKAGKTEFVTEYSEGIGRANATYDLMNTEQYLKMRMDAFENDGVSPGPTNHDVNGNWDKNRYTDWEDLLIGGTARLTNIQTTLSGGNEATQFLISGGYRTEGTVFPGDFKDTKISVQANINHQSSNKKFETSFTAMYLNDNNYLPINNLAASILLPPNAPDIYEEDGSLNWENSTWDNPFAKMRQKSTSITDNLNSSLTLSYEITNGLKITNRLGINSIRLNTTNINPAVAKNPNNAITDYSRNHTFGDNKINSWIIEPTITYRKSSPSWGNVDALVGTTFQETVQDGYTILANGFSSDALIKDIKAATLVSIGTSTNSQYRYSAVFARLGYNYLDRYIINLTGRRDGSSRFGPNKQFGNFGAVGFAWILSKEEFWKNSLSLISFGKMRLSYGVTGNDQLEDYKYISTYSSNAFNYQGLIGLNPTSHTNPEYGWETVKKLEAALEFGALDNRIILNINWYRNRTDNQLVGYALPAMTGFPTVQANLPAVVQNSGTEMNIALTLIRQSNLHWTVSGNLTIPKNKLVSYPNIEGSSYYNRYEVGKSLFNSFMYRYTGINQQTGLYTFEDINQDGVLTQAQDRRFSKFIGQHYFGGLNSSFSFKNFQVDVFFQYVKQTGYNHRLLVPIGTSFLADGNIPSYFSNYWSELNNTAIYQKASQSYGSAAFNTAQLYNESDALVGNASFIRLKNVSITYAIPETLLNKLDISGLNLFIHGQNLLTFSHYKGIDPEIFTTYTLGAVPPIRMITTGVQLQIK